MKFGFSSMGCPDWDLETIVSQAAAMGFEGVELRGLQGELHLPACPALAQKPAAVAEKFRDAGVELACLATGNCFHWSDRKKIAEHKGQVREFIELAGQLGCPYVRVFGDEVPRGEQKDTVMTRIAGALRELAPVAAAHNTTLVLENHGDFINSRDIWYILDTVSHPAIKCCWNPCYGKVAGELASLSVPRLGKFIALSHVVDGRFNDDGALETYLLPGEGGVDLERYLDLLRGIAYDGYLIFDWPKLWVPSLAEPGTAFPAALAKIKGLLDKLAAVKELTAYKGDKNVPKYANMK